MEEAKRIQGISEYYFSKKLQEIDMLRKQGADIINLGIGNPDMPPPPQVLEALRNYPENPGMHGYQSYRGTSLLREAIADWSQRIYGIQVNPETEILPLLGSKEGIMHISQAFVNPGDEVLVPDPGYPTYRAVSQITGAITIPYAVVPETGINLEEIADKLTEKTKIIWINFPHMPTGIKANRQILSELIQLAKEKQILLVNDNPYSTILTTDYFSIFQLEGAKDVCLELNSVSKTFNMAGWRIGWVSGKKELIDAVLKVKSNMDSGMFLPLQLAAAKALKTDETWIHYMNNTYQKRKEIAVNIMQEAGAVSYTDRSGLFVWATLKNESAEQVTDRILYEKHVFITPGFIFGENGKNALRISLCTPEDKLEEALNRITTTINL